MKKLKPCPFCGGKVKVTKAYGGFSKPIWECLHQCEPRKWAICKGDTKKEVIKAWNRRPNER